MHFPADQISVIGFKICVSAAYMVGSSRIFSRKTMIVSNLLRCWLQSVYERTGWFDSLGYAIPRN